jgi:predicted HTH transcriptional regulator
VSSARPTPAPLWSAAHDGIARLEPAWLHGLLEQARECAWVEFKRDNDRPEAMAEYVSALANGAAYEGQPHGYLVWGIDDATQAWVGTDFRPELARKGNEDLRFWLTHQFRGLTEPEFFEVLEGARRAVVLRVPAAVGRPVVYAGEPWMRVGQHKVQLRQFPDHQRRLLQRLDRQTFEQRVAAEGCTTAEVWAQLDVPAFFRAALEPLPGDAGDALARLALWGCVSPQRLDGRWNVLNLGALLLARDLRPFAPLARKALRVVLYHGPDASAPSEELPLGERGYVLVLDEVMQALRLRLPADEVMQGAQRQRREHFPEGSLRELLVNALVHQDFSVNGAGPLVEVFEGRVDITNPGRPLMDVNRLIDLPAQSRNEVLARAMRVLRFCEERGSGIDRVVARAESEGLPAPLFEVLPAVAEGADFMRVRLFGPRPYARMSEEDRLRAVYLHACLLYQRGERLTNASLRQRLGLQASQAAQVSRLIVLAHKRGLIRPASDSARAYLPGWAAGGTAAAGA